MLPDRSLRFFILGFAVGWLVLRYTPVLIGGGKAATPAVVNMVPARATMQSVLARPAAAEATEATLSPDLHPPPPDIPPPAPAPTSLHGECVGRVTGTMRTLPDDIVLAIMTTEKRHGLIEMLRRSWLRDAKALLLTDAPGLAETDKQKVVIWRGHPDCGAADRGGPTIAIANTSFWGSYKWILHVDDDVLVNTANLARFLSAFDPDVPLWFSAHGCDPSYVARNSSRPPCVALLAARGCVGCSGRRSRLGGNAVGGLGGGLRAACTAAGSEFVPAQSALTSRKPWRGSCAGVPGVQGLRTFGAEVGQSYCGGTGCVFSRGYLRTFPHAEIFRNGTACQGCTRGQQDVLLSRCLFHHNPNAIAPIGIPGFFWGRPGERLVEQMLVEYPACIARADATAGAADGPRGRPARQRLCVRRHGLMEWFTLHLQVRGAFTTLYKELVPKLWQSTFRHGQNALPVPTLLQQSHDLERRVRPHADAQLAAWASRVCCGLLRRAFVPCNLGCTPWRMLYAYPRNASAMSDGRSGTAATPAAGQLPGSYAWLDGATDDVCGVGSASSSGAATSGDEGLGRVRLWEQPAIRGAETELLHPNKRQTWPNGAMRCDFCEGFFNGWRGF